MTKQRVVLVSVFLLLTVSGCASIVDGRRETVSFSSDPAGAQVIINGRAMGVTPTSIVLERSDYDNANVVFKKEGYQDQQVTLSTHLNAWFWGDILCGGLIGSTTDAVSGAMWEFSPNSYFVTLQPLKASQAEMDRLNYETNVRKFILFSNERLASDLGIGEGESLASLYSLLRVRESQASATLITLRTLGSPLENPVSFAQAVLAEFIKD